MAFGAYAADKFLEAEFASLFMTLLVEPPDSIDMAKGAPFVDGPLFAELMVGGRIPCFLEAEAMFCCPTTFFWLGLNCCCLREFD